MDERVLAFCVAAIVALVVLLSVVGYLVWKLDEVRRDNDALVRSAIKSKAYIHRNENSRWKSDLPKDVTNDTQVLSREEIRAKTNDPHEIRAHSRKPRPRRS